MGLGAPVAPVRPWRPVRPAVLAAAVVVALLLGGLGGLLLGRATGTAPVPAAAEASAAEASAAEAAAAGAAAVPAPQASRVAELQAEEAARDAQAVVGLTEQTEQVLDRLAPVVEEAGAFGPGAPPPPAEQVQRWREAAVQAREVYGPAPSAGTQVNVARAALVSALDDVDTMVEAFELARSDAAPDGPLSLAQRSLRSAALTWSVGATQLDAVNVDSGQGHVHLFLPAVEGSGALTSDPEPTAGDHEDGEEHADGETHDR